MHRDIKPDNILVTEDLEVKICDFGLSRSIKCEKKEKKVRRKSSDQCFTRYYRPPEVILGNEEYDEKVDIWSLGCSLSEVFQKSVKARNQL